MFPITEMHRCPRHLLFLLAGGAFASNSESQQGMLCWGFTKSLLPVLSDLPTIQECSSAAAALVHTQAPLIVRSTGTGNANQEALPTSVSEAGGSESVVLALAYKPGLAAMGDYCKTLQLQSPSEVKRLSENVS